MNNFYRVSANSGFLPFLILSVACYLFTASAFAQEVGSIARENQPSIRRLHSRQRYRFVWHPAGALRAVPRTVFNSDRIAINTELVENGTGSTMIEYPTFVTHLECSYTGKIYPADRLHGLSDAGKPLLPICFQKHL